MGTDSEIHERAGGCLGDGTSNRASSSSSSLQESQAELSLAVGMLAEFLAETAATAMSRNDFFTQADGLFQNALSLWKSARPKHSSGGTLLSRGYQLIICTLEERFVAYPSQSERHVQTLLKLLPIP